MKQNLPAIAKLLRYHLVRMTSEAGSDHLTSGLSAVELMAGLFFGGVFRADLKRPGYHNNDRLIFSKGHAAPLLYALYAIAGAIPAKELLQLRKFGSRLEGHPTMHFPYTEAPTGSLGQGLSVAIGEAVAAKHDHLSFRTYCLLGDSELSEGQVWEAVQFASHRKLDNLVAIVDVNRLGQSGPTMIGHHLETYAHRFHAFGWYVIMVDGHDLKTIQTAYKKAAKVKHKPVVILGRTIKGQGFAGMEDRNGFHGTVIPKDQMKATLASFGTMNLKLRGFIATPRRAKLGKHKTKTLPAVRYSKWDTIAPREAIGNALARLGGQHPRLLALDGEVKNSTYTNIFEAQFPERFIQSYIAEQHMVSMATGLARRGFRPVAATFAAFWSRAFDQLRMQSYAGVHAIYIGTHAGVHIGQDGVSQMGLQDISLFRTLEGSTIFYPSDAVSAEKLMSLAVKQAGIVYLRATRAALPVVYPAGQTFTVGGSNVLRKSSKDVATIVTAGATLSEALQAADMLAEKQIRIRVIDLYSIKPIDVRTLQIATRQTQNIVVVEDHYAEGGMAEAVRTAIGDLPMKFVSLSVRKTPRSGKQYELLAYEGIDAKGIMKTIMNML